MPSEPSRADHSASSRYFHMETAGSTTGIVFMIYAVGNLCGSLVVGPITDSWGRRWGMFMGSAIVIAGAAVQGSAYSHWMFLGGRFILGFGVSISVVAGPTYVAEMAHPAWRGPMTGLYNTFYYFGAVCERTPQLCRRTRANNDVPFVPIDFRWLDYVRDRRNQVRPVLATPGVAAGHRCELGGVY